MGFEGLSNKNKHFFFVLIKISIVVVAFYFIYEKLTKNTDLEFSIFGQISMKNDVFLIKHMFFLSFLTIFNWFFEVLKWKELVSSIKKISFKKAFEQCLGSLTASLFTPNRIGEYGAKALYYTKGYRKQIMLVNLISNLLQMSITCIFGIIGLFFLDQAHEISMNKWPMILLVSVILTTSIILIIRRNRYSFKGFSFEKLKNFMSNFSKKSVALGLLFSLFRYAIFSFQFYYLLVLFGCEISYFNAMTFVTSMYFLASIIPSIFIFDVVVKGSIAVFLFSLIGVTELVILSIVTIMWIFNFVLPSILGSYFVIRFKLPTLAR
ncbi:lysylphosphatidylglycerol synthase domain-containing protein [Gaetbulibacter sp. M235]|uniref:lysylphosphatidylglycerol synthase domain-containing protein n=1 Tax=Gaetbulibacter sp. M235 TaxID=3126510 RepID=UPI00374F4147